MPHAWLTTSSHLCFRQRHSCAAIVTATRCKWRTTEGDSCDGCCHQHVVVHFMFMMSVHHQAHDYAMSRMVCGCAFIRVQAVLKPTLGYDAVNGHYTCTISFVDPERHETTVESERYPARPQGGPPAVKRLCAAPPATPNWQVAHGRSIRHWWHLPLKSRGLSG